jgi:hypothetical protein
MRADREAWTQWATKHPNPRAPLRNKYGAVKVHHAGHCFDSKREAVRYEELRMLEAAGEIADLEVHPAFPLMVPELVTDGPPWVFHTIGQYHADFQYRNVRTGNVIVEDVKSKPTRTESYKRTKKHVEAQYQITIVEVL